MDLPATGAAPGTQPLGSPTKFRIAARFMGAVVIGIAAAALLGWIVGMEGSYLLPRDLQQMKPLSAMGFILCGAGLIIVNSRRRTRWTRRAGVALGFGVVGLGLLILAENSFSLDLRIYHFFYSSVVRETAERHPGRSSIIAGFGLVLYGLAFIALGGDGRRGEVTAQAMALLAGFIGVAVIIGYIFGSERFTELPGDLPLALDTAVCFLVSTLGFVAATPWVGAMEVLTAGDVGGRIARRLIPVAIFVPLLLQWLMIEGLQLRLYGLTFGTSLAVTAMIIVFTAVVWRVARSIALVDRERTRIEVERAMLLKAEHRGREEAERIRSEAERRALQEAALRRAAEEITAVYSVDEVISGIAHNALEATGADISFVERVHHDLDELEVVAVTGEGAPTPGYRCRFSGSLAQEVIERDESLLLRRMDEVSTGLLGRLAQTCPACSALLVPLRDATEAIGVLVLVKRPNGAGFNQEEVDRANTFANLAVLASRKISLLEDSEQRRRELEEVTESRARLVRGFSHDLKNPLGAADGYAELLESGIFGALSERQQESVRRIRDALHSALDLIGDLVELARSESGQLEIEWRVTDLAEIVRAVTEEHRAAAEAAGLTLDVEVAENMPKVVTDGRRVRQIMGNLLSNAIKYTPSGGRVVVGAMICTQGPDRQPGRWNCLTVQDNGPGIPQEKLPLLFHEFVRFSEATGGVGLGLAISQRIARLLGGDLTVVSEVGVGSTFTLWIPEHEPASDRVAEDGGTIGPETGQADRPRRKGGNLLRELSIERARLEMLVQNLPIGVAFAEAPSGAILITNPALEKIVRHPIVHLPGLEAYDQWQGYHEDGRRYAAAEWPLARALRSGEEVSGEELKYRRGDGVMTWLRVDAAPIFGRKGRIIGAVASLIDIAEDRRIADNQALLADASSILGSIQDVPAMIESLARRVVESEADICIVFLRDEGASEARVAAAAHRDPAQAEATSRLYQMSVARHLREVNQVLDAGEPVLIAEVSDEWLRDAAVDEEQFALFRELRPISIVVAPFNARDKTFGALAFVRTEPGQPYDELDLQLVDEIARRTALSIDNSRLYSAALAASHAKSEFLAVISHELRTPLNAIVGYADLLLMGIPEPLSDDARHQVERIMESAKHLRGLIEEVLSLSRLAAGEEEVNNELTEIGGLVREAAGTAAQLAQVKGLEFDVDLPDTDMEILTDPGKVKRILHNLLSNAVKFTEEGRIRVQAGLEDSDVVIRVSDTGIGIAPEEHERIFEPFWQVERGTTRQVGGAGLGLGVSSSLAKLIGGELTVESASGKGSTFTLRIPARPESD